MMLGHKNIKLFVESTYFHKIFPNVRLNSKTD